MISFRNATINDIPIIQALAEKTWWPTYSPILTKEQNEFMVREIYSEDSLRKAIQENQQSFIFITASHEHQGFASYSTWKEDPSYWKIHKLYVLPESHGKGYGKALLDEIFSRARVSGVRSVVLNVNRHNPAMNFYLKIGFQKLREEDIPIGPYWMNDYVMKIDI